MSTTIDPQYLAPVREHELDDFTRAYIETAFWSSTEYAFGECPCCGRMAILDKFPEPEFQEQAMCSAEGCGVREISNPDPMDQNYSFSDLAPEALARIRQDCATFQALYKETIQAAINTGEVKCGPDFDEWGRAGHDFWLTRAGHGAGFWDGDWPEPMAEHLSDAARKCGECDLYVGDDGRIFIFG
jgi:hypothetical protein